MKHNQIKVALWGAGGHAKVVYSTALSAGFIVSHVFDEDPKKTGLPFMNTHVLSCNEHLSTEETNYVIAIGDNRTRQKTWGSMKSHMQPISLIHSTAYIDPTAQIGLGTVICAGTVIQPHTVIGNHVIINTGATVDHDCLIEDFVHIGPGTHLSGGVTLKEGVFLGIGTQVIPNQTIGYWTTVGAGSTVIHTLPDGVTAFGSPATVKKMPINDSRVAGV